MKSKVLEQALEHEVEDWRAMPFDELRSRPVRPHSYFAEMGDGKLQVEVQLLENLDDRLHVMVSVDDSSLFRAMFPVSASFLVHRDGGVSR